MKKLSAIFISLFLFWSSFIYAQNITDGLEKEQTELFKDVSDQLRCPTCTGLSILQSDAEFSVQMKEAVKEQVVQGKNADQIIEFFTERYGLWILREPPKRGIHLFAWLIPASLLVLGPFFIWLLVWRKRQTVRTYGVRSSSSIMSEMARKLDEMRG